MVSNSLLKPALLVSTFKVVLACKDYTNRCNLNSLPKKYNKNPDLDHSPACFAIPFTFSHQQTFFHIHTLFIPFHFQPDKSLALNISWSYFSAVKIRPPKNLAFNAETAFSTSSCAEKSTNILTMTSAFSSSLCFSW